MDPFSHIPGHFWMNRRDYGWDVCGRSGKIVERFGADEEGQACDMLRWLQGKALPFRAPAIRLNKTERQVLASFATRGEMVVPGLSDFVQSLGNKGLLAIAPAGDKYRVEITPAGQEWAV